MTTRRALLKSALGLSIAHPLFSRMCFAQQDNLPDDIVGRLEPIDALDAFLGSFVRQHRLRGAGIVVVKRNRLVYASSSGYVLTTEDRPLLPDTLVPIGSVTKFLTALGIMKLVQNGKLKLDAPFLPYLPTLLIGGIELADPRWKQITIRQLLQMCAGIPEDLTAMWKFRDRLKSRRDAYKMMLARSLEYAPEQKQVYNNCNFSILGDVIEAISGRKWRQFVFEEIVRPVGIAQLPAFDEIGLQGSSTDANWNSGSEGVACMSLLDLAKLVREFSKTESRIPLELKTRVMMVQPPPPPLFRNEDGSLQMGYYGLGLMSVGWDDGNVAFSHGGSLPNAHTFFVRHTDGSIYVGFYCGELASDKSGSGQWTFCGDLLKVTARIRDWPKGVEF